MKKTIGLMVLALALAAVICLPAVFAESAEDADTIVTIIHAPEQTGPERPPCFPDPSDNFIPLPETENYAQGKPVASGAHTDVYVSRNVNDGKTDTYWESKGSPAEMTIDLQDAYTISTVAVCLNPSSIWEPRTQEIALQVSTDGETYTEIVKAARYDFDAATGNRIRIDFEPVQASFVKVIFTMNTAARTGGAQAAEICVY